MTGNRTKYLIAGLLLLAFSVKVKAQEEDNSFVGGHYLEVSHKIGDSPRMAILYFEHGNHQYQRHNCRYLRPRVHYKPLSWLKLGVSYDYLRHPDTYGHRAVFDVVGTLKENNPSATLRLRYLHTWRPELVTEDNELRTRLIILYTIPQTRFMPYMAVEIFTWGKG